MSKNLSTKQKGQCRQFAFQFLYHLQTDSSKHLWEEALEGRVAENRKELQNALVDFEVSWNEDDEEMKNSPLTTDARALGEKMIFGVLGSRKSLEAMLAPKLKGLGADKVHKIDRCVLLLALYELKEMADTPVAVVIDQAVGLAKKFGDNRSGPFVNGVLDSVAREIRPGSKNANNDQR